ncbi:MAG: 1,4-alpha-glucan branching protein domain-containing protein [Chthoniobacterales bacterium]
MMGYLALLLHAHLPFVRHPEHDEFLEEDWLFEAITETYIPLVAMLHRLLRERVPFKLTLSVTPTLVAMLQDELLVSRYIAYLDRSIDLALREIERNKNHEKLLALSQFYHVRLNECRRLFVDDWQCDLIAELRGLRTASAIEIVASAATHGLLPLLQETPEAVRAQILVGCDAYREAFGAEPVGFWLPECAYSPGIETGMQEANLRWFVVDAHGLMFGKPRPLRAIYAPCYTGAGPAAFARDPESTRQVWSAEEGYPGDPVYREFYRDIGFELAPEYIRPHRADSRLPGFTGLKYHRVTRREGEKELYDREQACAAADAHASHYLESRRRQINELDALDFDPIVVVPFDAELFGHWWFEGPRFLESFIRKVAASAENFRLTTPTEYLMEHPTLQTIVPAASSWGDEGYWKVWLGEKNAWLYPHLRRAARQMTDLARHHARDHTPGTDRALRQLARELLLAQSSDWAFLMNSGTATEYATKRTKTHLLRFNQLREEFAAGAVNESFLSECESRDNIFPHVNWRYYI